jgi:uncharacterized membrane protein
MWQINGVQTGAMLSDWVKELTLWLSSMTEGIAAVIIAIAVAEAAVRTAMALSQPLFRSNVARPPETKEDIRLRLGRWLALALEFLLAADILRTAVSPSWSEIGQLAAIAAIRTALNYVLQQEIDKAARRREPASGGPSLST